MSIHKRMRKDGTVSYTVRYREGDKNRQATFASKKDAAAFEAQTRLASRTGTLRSLDAGKITVAEFGEQWWEGYVQQRLEVSTRATYAQQWNSHVLPYLGDTSLREITPRSIEEWRGKLERAGIRAPTVKKSMNVLQSCLQRAVVWGELQVNPVREVKKPSGKRVRAIRPVSPAEIEGIRQYLIAQAKHRDATLVSVLAYAGLRPGEALGLGWEHIRTNTILVERAASHGELKETKTGKIRSVKLLPALRHDLNEWRARSQNTGGLIFPSRATGGPWCREAYKSWERKAFKTAATQIGRADATPYALRHSFASLLIREGRSIVEVAAQLGHAPTMTLDTYAHVFADLDEEDRRPAGQMIEEAREQFLRANTEQFSREHLGNPNGNVRVLFARDRDKRRLTA